MPVTISHNALEELTNAIEELERLTSQPTMSKRDEHRHAALLAKISLLKNGVSVHELRGAERERILAEAGLARDPQSARTKLPASVEREWRDFGVGKDVRLTSRPPDREIRAYTGELAGQQSIATTQGAAGGFFVPQGIHDRAFETMKQHDQVFDERFSNVVETDTGANMPFPSWDDVANASVQVGETVQSTEVEIANFGNVQLGAFAFRSKIIAVSLELLQDSNFPWPSILERVFAMRHARGVGQALVTGSGVNAPTGLLTAVVASGAVPVVASGSSGNTGGSETGATSLGTSDINACYAKLNPAYRTGACWYMADETLESLRTLLDKEGRPIVDFRRSLTDVYIDTPFILGKPVAVCPSMPSIGATKNPVVFANPFYFVQRRVPSAMYVRRFSEAVNLIEYGLAGFESWLRVDSNLVAPNSSYLPAQFIQCHS